MVIYKMFLEPETETIVNYKETFHTDTVYVTVRDTVWMDRTKIKHTFVRDTVLIQPIEPKIKAYEARFPLYNGYAYVNGEVLGEVIKMRLTTDFKVATVTNTIEKETTKTIVKKPSGLYAQAWVDSELFPSVGGTYLRDRMMINYKYTPLTNTHAVGFGIRIF
jgi:hypothetical protein